MAEPFIGEIRMFAGNFAPQGWALCNGQILSIAQNTALFSLLGTNFGGNGQTTFGLPNLQSRMPMHWGTGPGLTPRVIGENAGEESVPLNTNQIPAHNHTYSPRATASPGNATSPGGNVWAASSTRDAQYSPTPDTTMQAQATDATGGSQAHDNMPPFLCVTFIIALEGIYPPRS
jgi:microcystin-dependent protein